MQCTQQTMQCLRQRLHMHSLYNVTPDDSSAWILSRLCFVELVYNGGKQINGSTNVCDRDGRLVLHELMWPG